MKKVFFSSDYHLGHKNIIEYDNRPFTDVDEMDDVIISNHNKIVGKNDDFYFLGNFSFNNKTEHYLRRLNGNKFFVRGNHDRSETIKLYKQYGTYLGDIAHIRVNEQEIILCHYAMRVRNKSHRGVWHLYGHSHGTLPDDSNSKSFDCGINCHNYFPLEFKDVSKIMSTKTFKPVDHHDRRD